MADLYRIFGSKISPYSVKVRCYFGFKAIPHQWILHNRDSRAEHQKHVKLPIIPLVVTARQTCGGGRQGRRPSGAFRPVASPLCLPRYTSS
jgi:hypothetical protein